MKRFPVSDSKNNAFLILPTSDGRNLKSAVIMKFSRSWARIQDFGKDWIYILQPKGESSDFTVPQPRPAKLKPCSYCWGILERGFRELVMTTSGT